MTSLTEHIASAAQLYSQNTSMSDVEEALTYISSDIVHDDWVRVGMALKSELGDEGYSIFEFWSSLSDKFNEADCKSTWRSISDDGGVGIGTLFLKAKEGGYRPSKNGMHKPTRVATSAPKRSCIDEPAGIIKSCEIAQDFWQQAMPNLPHNYATRKGFPDHDLRVSVSWLCVPAYNRDGQIQSIQRIPPEGKKKNLTNTKIRGCYYPIKGDKSTVVIAEGWATAMSVNAATGYACAVSFGCAALKQIAKIMSKKLPDALIIIAADTDHVAEAEEAAIAVSGLVAVPHLKSGTDFNDLHINESLESVTSQFQECIEKGYVSYGSDSVEEEINWFDPEPLPNELRPVPELDYQLLPASIRDWIADIADRQGCPAEFPAVTAIVHLGAVIGRKFGIRPKRHGDPWTVVPNLWGGCIGPPSMMKSPAIVEARTPFKKVEDRLFEDAKAEQTPLREEYAIRLFKHEAEEKVIKEDWGFLIKGKAPRGRCMPDRADLNERSAAQAQEKAELKELYDIAYAPRALETHDSTPEALQQLLSTNPNGIMYFNDELTSWLEALGKPGREGSRQMHIEMWNGTDRGNVDRIGRGHIEFNKIESIFGSIQPGPLGKLVSNAMSINRANDGLFQRFQVLVWRNNFKGTPKDKKPNVAALVVAERAFMGAYEATAESIGCNDAGIPYLLFTPEAYDIWWPWYKSMLERARVEPDERAAHLTKFSSLVPSLALIDHIADGGRGDVGIESIKRAIGLADWLWEHALRMYSSGHYLQQSSLIKLCRHVLRGDLDDGFTFRDVHRKGWSGITLENTQNLLAELVEMHWVKYSPIHGDRGGPISHSYRLNPKLRECNLLSGTQESTATTDITTTHPPTNDGYGSYGSECSHPENVDPQAEHTDDDAGVSSKELF